jgi:hypothetical protein
MHEAYQLKRGQIDKPNITPSLEEPSPAPLSGGSLCSMEYSINQRFHQIKED